MDMIMDELLSDKAYIIQAVILLTVILVLTIHLRNMKASMKSVEGKHVVVTGGSSGIGKAVAIEAAAKGAHVTVISRNAVNLEKTVSEVLKHCKDRQTQKIQYISLDVTEDYETIKKALVTLEEDVGPVFMLANCAGMAICGRLEDMTIPDIKHMVNLNFFGSVYPTKALIGGMKSRGEGIVVFVSSQAALLGIYGYGAYGAAKWGIRGLAESLRMETHESGVSTTICFPPDTDTPGFATEASSKPQETKLISDSGTLATPEAVALQLMEDAMCGQAYSTVGIEGWMLILVTGLAWNGLMGIFAQFFVMSPFRLILGCYQVMFNRIIVKCKAEKNTNKKAE